MKLCDKNKTFNSLKKKKKKKKTVSGYAVIVLCENVGQLILCSKPKHERINDLKCRDPKLFSYFS